MVAPDAPPPPRSSGTGSVRERMAQAAREKPPAPELKRWVWLVVLGVGAAIALAQLFGLTSSPVAEKMKRGKAADAAPAKGAPPAPADGQGTTR
ncbi:MAG: hypothetical protein JNM10_06375 [Planctomycetia bacterium]|nr:hypothetical protein [Planctomycetia bacterium]